MTVDDYFQHYHQRGRAGDFCCTRFEQVTYAEARKQAKKFAKTMDLRRKGQLVSRKGERKRHKSHSAHRQCRDQ